nr:hypothetical protein [Candidatus Nitrosocosmicus arcticus]
MVKVASALVEAIMIAFLPIVFNFCTGNSIPTVKSNSITPISVNRLRTSRLRIKLNGGLSSPIIIPATMKPIAMGCLNL